MSDYKPDSTDIAPSFDDVNFLIPKSLIQNKEFPKFNFFYNIQGQDLIQNMKSGMDLNDFTIQLLNTKDFDFNPYINQIVNFFLSKYDISLSMDLQLLFLKNYNVPSEIILDIIKKCSNNSIIKFLKKNNSDDIINYVFKQKQLYLDINMIKFLKTICFSCDIPLTILDEIEKTKDNLLILHFIHLEYIKNESKIKQNPQLYVKLLKQYITSNCQTLDFIIEVVLFLIQLSGDNWLTINITNLFINTRLFNIEITEIMKTIQCITNNFWLLNFLIEYILNIFENIPYNNQCEIIDYCVRNYSKLSKKVYKDIFHLIQEEEEYQNTPFMEYYQNVQRSRKKINYKISNYIDEDDDESYDEGIEEEEEEILEEEEEEILEEEEEEILEGKKQFYESMQPINELYELISKMRIQPYKSSPWFQILELKKK